MQPDWSQVGPGVCANEVVVRVGEGVVLGVETGVVLGVEAGVGSIVIMTSVGAEFGGGEAVCGACVGVGAAGVGEEQSTPDPFPLPDKLGRGSLQASNPPPRLPIFFSLLPDCDLSFLRLAVLISPTIKGEASLPSPRR